MVNPRFIRRVNANLNYWLSASQQVSDVTLTQWEKERHNLYLAVKYGLQIPETAVASARLIHQLFPLIERRGFWAEWLPILNQAIIASSTTDTFLQLSLMNQLGFIRRLQQNLDQAITIHSKVVELAEKHGHNQAKAEAFFYLGYVHYYYHHYEESRQYAEWALTEFNRLGLTSEDKKMGAIYNLLGLLARASGDQETAGQMFSQSIERWRRTDELTYLATALSNMGLIFLDRKQFAKALAYFDEARDILELTASQLEKARVSANRGVVYFEQGDWHGAERAYREAYSPSLQHMGDKYLRAFIANNLGCALMKQERWKEAMSWLNQSRELWVELKNDLMLGNIFGSLGETAAALGRHEIAKAYFEEAIGRLTNFPEDVFAKTRLEEVQYLCAHLVGDAQ